MYVEGEKERGRCIVHGWVKEEEEEGRKWKWNHKWENQTNIREEGFPRRGNSRIAGEGFQIGLSDAEGHLETKYLC